MDNALSERYLKKKNSQIFTNFKGVFFMFNDYSSTKYYARETNLMYRVYAWMCLALTLTAAVAFFVAGSPAFINALFTNQWLLIGLFIGQLALVIILTTLLNRMTFAMAAGLFLLYAATLGLTLSSIFIVYTYTSIAATFLVTAGMFGAMALYGYFTKADLSSMGSYLLMALIGIIIGGVVNLFLKNATFHYVLSAVGVLVFTLLTAYDVQKIKNMSQEMLADRETMAKVSILGALVLYLDFVNLFLFLLQFMGRRKE